MTALDRLTTRFARIAALDEAAGVLHWDASVMMPEGGGADQRHHEPCAEGAVARLKPDEGGTGVVQHALGDDAREGGRHRAERRGRCRIGGIHPRQQIRLPVQPLKLPPAKRQQDAEDGKGRGDRPEDAAACGGGRQWWIGPAPQT